MALDVNNMTKDQLKQHILMLAMELTEKNKKIDILESEIKWYKKTIEEFGMRWLYIDHYDECFEQ